jgi:hypothetical protein
VRVREARAVVGALAAGQQPKRQVFQALAGQFARRGDAARVGQDPNLAQQAPVIGGLARGVFVVPIEPGRQGWLCAELVSASGTVFLTRELPVPASFHAFPLAAKLAFLALGPMLDVKLMLMYSTVFKPRAIGAIRGTAAGSL